MENLQGKQQFRERASVPSTRLDDVMMKQTKGEIESFTDNLAAALIVLIVSLETR